MENQNLPPLAETEETFDGALMPEEIPSEPCPAEEPPVRTPAVPAGEAICRQIARGDYEAAVCEAESMADFFPERTLALLRGAADRMRLREAPLLRLLDEEDKKRFFPVYRGDRMPLFEYLLRLQWKVRQGDIDGFARGIPPALFQLARRYLKGKLGVDLERYTDAEGCLNRDELAQTPQGRDILRRLDRRLTVRRNGRILIRNGRPVYLKYRSSPVSTDLCLFLISVYGGDAVVRDTFRRVRDYVRAWQGVLDHEVTPPDARFMKQQTGTTPDEVMARLRFLAGRTIAAVPDHWQSLERMNEWLQDVVRHSVSG